MITITRAEPGTSRRSQLRVIAVREARLREIWLSIFQGWSRIANVKELRDAATFGGVNLEAIVGQLELELRRREEQLVGALTLGPIVRGELEEFLTPLGPVTTQTLAERQIGARVVELTSQARVNLREQLTLLMREGPTDDILAAIATSTGLTRRQTRAVNNFRRRLIEQGASAASAGRQAEAYAVRALRRRARLIARTEAVDFTAQIVEERGRQVGNMTKQWVSARDGGVEEICTSLDNGQRVPVGRPFQGISGSIGRPTAHPGCRCVLELSRSKPKRGTRPPRRRQVRRPRRAPAPTPPKPPPPPTGEARTAAQVGAELEEISKRTDRIVSGLQAKRDDVLRKMTPVQTRLNQISDQKAVLRRTHGVSPFASVPAPGSELLPPGFGPIAQREAARRLVNDRAWIKLTAEQVRLEATADVFSKSLDRSFKRLSRVGLASRNVKRAAIRRPVSERNLAKLPNRARDPSRKRLRETGIERWRDLVSKRWLTTPDGRPIRVPIRSTREFRSYQLGGEVFISPSGDFTAVVHELGHAVEHFHPDVLRSSLAFLDRRTAGEAARHLADIFPNGSFKVAEMTRADAFIDAYVGKDYQRRATEIFSMGIEYMAKDPLSFWRRDPEHFAYIWDIMRGILP